MFLKLLKDSDEEVWDTYYVFEKDSPSDAILAQYKVVVVCMYALKAVHVCSSEQDTNWQNSLQCSTNLQRLKIQCQHSTYDIHDKHSLCI